MMENNKVYFTLILIIVNFFQVSCQSIESSGDCDKCTLKLKPIIDFEVCLGMNTKEVSALFDSFIEYVPDPRLINEETAYFKIEKEIHLPNSRTAMLKGILKFINGKLTLINFTVPISENYKYIQELKLIIEKYDREGLNKYIYESNNNLSILENENCTHAFFWRNGLDDMNIYEINVKMYKS